LLVEEAQGREQDTSLFLHGKFRNLAGGFKKKRGEKECQNPFFPSE
jgi:hypothetical protein